MIFVAGLLAASASYLISRSLVSPLRELLVQGGLVRPNYRGIRIPVGIGVAIPLAALGPWTFLGIWGTPWQRVSLFLVLAFGMGVLGLLDDALGDRRTTGLRGHIGALLAGRPTTGSFKALFGGLLALYAGLALYGPSWKGLIAAALVAASTNAVNLLDVRPGRALKGHLFLLGVAGLAWSGSRDALGAAQVASAAVPLGACLALWRGDHRGEWMLGDVGANVLGASAGLALAAAPLAWQFAVLLLLVLLHLYAEKRSLSQLIDAVPLLSRLDRWGR